MTHRSRHRTMPVAGLSLLAALALGACSSDDDGASAEPDAGGDTPLDGGTDDISDADGSGDTPFDADDERLLRAFVSTSQGFETGQIERLIISDEIVSTGATPATESDIRVATDGEAIYQIGRFLLDSVTRFDPDALDTPVWQYSVNGEETEANPYEIVFASETKAYVIRYGSGTIWIVDPTATTEANFRTGTIDLSAYDADGVPEMNDAVLVDDRLFVLMERLDDFQPVRNGYVAVIDTATDTEIDTGEGLDGLFGIALQVANPIALRHVEERDELLLVGRGNFFGGDVVEGDPYSGGVETIDTESYENALLIDDGTVEDNDGFFYDVLAGPDGSGFLLTYDGFGDTTLRRFDPLSGAYSATPVDGFENLDIGVLELDPEGRLWIGINDVAAPGFRVIDPDTEATLIERVPTEFNPTSVVFLTEDSGDDAIDDPTEN